MKHDQQTARWSHGLRGVNHGRGLRYKNICLYLLAVGKKQDLYMQRFYDLRLVFMFIIRNCLCVYLSHKMLQEIDFAHFGYRFSQQPHDGRLTGL